MITAALLQSVDMFSVSSDTLKEWGSNVKEQQHEILNMVSRWV